MPDDLIGSFIDRGLYSPAADDAGDRLALLTHYAERGITIDRMVEAEAAGRLQTLSGDLLFFDVGPELTIEEVAERCAIGIDRVLRIRLASGLPTDVDTTVPSWALDDVAGFTLAAALFGEAATLAFSRVMGAGAARLADAAVSLFLTEVDTSLSERHAAPIDWALANEEAARLVDVVASINAHLLREHLALAIRRQRSMVSPGQGAVVRTTIGFVDLARSTEWASSLSPLAQAGALAVFESAAWDIATRHGGRIVKLIGDEVMFTVGEPAAACDIAIELCAAVSAEQSLPSARAAIGFGEVAFRDGDFFGPLVHVVARAVKTADEGAVVADAAVRERCEAEGFPAHFEALEPQELRGVPKPVVLHVVTPAAGSARAMQALSARRAISK